MAFSPWSIASDLSTRVLNPRPNKCLMASAVTARLRIQPYTILTYSILRIGCTATGQPPLWNEQDYCHVVFHQHVIKLTLTHCGCQAA